MYHKLSVVGLKWHQCPSNSKDSAKDGGLGLPTYIWYVFDHGEYLFRDIGLNICLGKGCKFLAAHLFFQCHKMRVTVFIFRATYIDKWYC